MVRWIVTAPASASPSNYGRIPADDLSFGTVIGQTRPLRPDDPSGGVSDTAAYIWRVNSRATQSLGTFHQIERHTNRLD
jgi:hypothetical protein